LNEKQNYRLAGVGARLIRHHALTVPKQICQTVSRVHDAFFDAIEKLGSGIADRTAHVITVM